MYIGTSSATSRTLSYADRLLFTGDVKVVSTSFRPSAASANKAALQAVSIDLAAQTVGVAFFSDAAALTPVTVQSTVTVVVNGTSDLAA
ncbi:hypothetical protein D3C76_1601540 [compost metagenome]